MARSRVAAVALAFGAVIGIGLVTALSSLGASTITPLAIGQSLATAGTPGAVAVNALGTRAYVTDSAQNALYVFDLASGKAVGWIPTGLTPGPVVLVGTRAFVSNFADRSITEIDTVGSHATKTLAVGGLGLAADPARGMLFAAAGAQLVVLDTTTDSRLATIAAPTGASLWGVAFEPVTQRLFVTDSLNARVLVYDTNAFGLIAQVALDAPARLAITTAGGSVFVASYTDRSAQVSVIDAATATITTRRAAVAFASTLAVDASGVAYLASAADRSVSGVANTSGTRSRAAFDALHLPGAAAVHPVSGAVIAATAGGAPPPARPFPDPVQVVRP